MSLKLVAQSASGFFAGAVVLNGVYILKGQSMPPIKDTLMEAGLLYGSLMGAMYIGDAVDSIVKKSEIETLSAVMDKGGGFVLTVSANLALYAYGKLYLTGQPVSLEDAVVAFFYMGSSMYAGAPVTLLFDAMGLK